MNEEEFLQKFGDFQDLFNIVEEPINSKEKLLEFEEKYCSSPRIVNSQMLYWYYKTQDFKILKEVIPEIDEWIYYYERFLRYGGDPNEFTQMDNYRGQANESKEPSDCVKSLGSFLNKLH